LRGHDRRRCLQQSLIADVHEPLRPTPDIGGGPHRSPGGTLIQITDSPDVKSSFLVLTKHQAHVEAEPPGHAGVPRNSQEPP